MKKGEINAEEARKSIEDIHRDATHEAFQIITQKYQPAKNEADADVMHDMEHLQKIFAQENITIFPPILIELLQRADFNRELVTKHDRMQLLWLFKEKQ